MPELVAQTPTTVGGPWEVAGELLLVGRGGDADVRLEHPSVSRIHARLERSPDGWTVQDLDSTTGTWVNDARCVAAARLSAGDRLRVGAVQCVFRDGAAVAAPVGTPLVISRRRAVAIISGVIIVAVAAGMFAGGRFAGQPAPTVPAPPHTAADAAPSASDMHAGQAMPPMAEPGAPPETTTTGAPATVVTMPGDATSQPASAATAMQVPIPESPEPTPAKTAVLPPAPVAPAPPAAETAANQPHAEPPSARAPAEHAGETCERGQWMPTAALAARGRVDAAGHLVPTDAERHELRRLWFDLLGRPPTAADLAAALTTSREALVDRLLASPEHALAWYEDTVHEFLLLDDFRPGDDHLNDLPGRLAAGKAGLKDALGEIVQSQDFNARNPGNDTYVTVVLEQLLGVNVQNEPKLLEAGKLMYDGRAATLFGRRGSSQGNFVAIVLDQPACLIRALTTRARHLLDEEPPKKDMERFATVLRAEPLALRAIEHDIVMGARYQARLATLRRKSDTQFVRGLYQDVLGRLPTYQEMRNMRNATQALADPAGLRSIVMRSMLTNADAALPDKAGVTDAPAWITGRFQALLARTPTADELKAFVGVWNSAAGSPALIVHALLTGAEYQRY